MLCFDLSLACAVSKWKVRWSVCGIKTTDLVSMYRLRRWLKGNLSETDFSVQASQRASLSVCGVLQFYSQVVLFLPDT